MPGTPIEAVIEQLRELADEEFRTFNESLTPGIEGKSLGVRMPALRKVAKQILKNDSTGFLDASLNSAVHEINLLHAIMLAGEVCTCDQKLIRIVLHMIFLKPIITRHLCENRADKCR